MMYNIGLLYQFIEPDLEIVINDRMIPKEEISLVSINRCVIVKIELCGFVLSEKIHVD